MHFVRDHQNNSVRSFIVLFIDAELRTGKWHFHRGLRAPLGLSCGKGAGPWLHCIISALSKVAHATDQASEEKPRSWKSLSLNVSSAPASLRTQSRTTWHGSQTAPIIILRFFQPGATQEQGETCVSQACGVKMSTEVVSCLHYLWQRAAPQWAGCPLTEALREISLWVYSNLLLQPSSFCTSLKDRVKAVKHSWLHPLCHSLGHP